MPAQTAGRIALLTTGLIATGCLGYAVYFDYMRRHSADFRRSIKKQHDAIAAAAEEKNKTERERNARALLAVLDDIQTEAPPISPEQQEVYFQEQVAQGEQLAVMGPEHHVEAASRFYRALRVYPAPIELIQIYKKVVPPPVFNMVIELTMISEARSAAGGDFAMPPQAAPSIEDLDDSSPPSSSSPKADSATSGTSWEKLDAA